MTREETQQAHESQTPVTVTVLGQRISGVIQEYGFLQVRAKVGMISRACAVVRTEQGDVYTHISNIEKN